MTQPSGASRSRWCRSLAPAIAVVTVAVACGGTRGETAPPPPLARAAPAPRGPAAESVETTIVRRGLLQATVTASGSVASPRVTELGPEVGGRLLRVLVDVGDTVRAGAAVFRLDPEPYRLDLEEAEAGLALARAELDQAAQEMARARRLADQQIVPQQQLDTQVTHHAVQRARVTQAEARVHRAQQDLDRTTVRAPYDGFVVERGRHEGAMLTSSSVVLTLQQAGGYEAILSVPEAARLPVRPGDPVRLVVEGIPGHIPSRVRAVNARIDAQSRTYEVRVPIEADAAVVKAGAFVRGEIDPVPAAEALLIDREAVLVRDGRSYAFRHRDGTAEQVSIELGAIGARLAEVHRGLDDGDQVVVGDVVERLADGSPIRVIGERPLPLGPSAAEPVGVAGARVTTSVPVAPPAAPGGGP
ncbi:MAG TPA: efflux RND transporter periplasmic adaptor subunit [Thermoanaerobaculia bacterium]|nr:efflux RND transporter periplasmic adaptor subunit [Thermoanaerobaculia bacterium]